MGVELTVVMVAGIIMAASIAISVLDNRRKKNDNASADLYRRIEELEKYVAQQDETLAGLIEDNDFVRRMIEDKTEK